MKKTFRNLFMFAVFAYLYIPIIILTKTVMVYIGKALAGTGMSVYLQMIR